MMRTQGLTSGLLAAIALSGLVPAQAFGVACGGQGGVPTISVQPDLRPGSSSTVSIANLPANRSALLWLGSSNSSWGGVALPLPLAPLGMNGCELAIRPEIGLLFSTGTGTASSSFFVPLNPALAAQRLYWQVMFAQPGLNPAGTGWTRALETRIAPLPTPVTMVSSITQYGITFQFAAPVPAGQFVNGDWFVVGPVTLTGMTPPCVTVNGRVMNGAMVDPDASTRAHGYDKGLYGAGNEALYSDALNVALNLSPTQPRVLQPDQSLVKVISNTNTAFVPQIETCAVLTVLATPPPQGSFRPPYSGTDHAVRYDVQMIDWSRLLNLTPASGLPDVTAIQAQLTRCWLDHAPGWPSRYLHPVLNMPDYGRDFASLYNEAALLCHTAITPAEKQALVRKLVQIGIDFHGNVQNGCYWEGVGGHGSGRKWPILFAGALLHDAGMLAVGTSHPSQRNLDGSYSIHFGEDGQTFYVQQTSATQVNWGYGGYDSADVGTPEFGFSHVHWPQSDAEGWTANSYRRCCTANAWLGAVLGARMMGLVDEWNHPALFDYTDRYTQVEPVGWTRSWAPWVGRMWDLYRPSY